MNKRKANKHKLLMEKEILNKYKDAIKDMENYREQWLYSNNDEDLEQYNKARKRFNELHNIAINNNIHVSKLDFTWNKKIF